MKSRRRYTNRKNKKYTKRNKRSHKKYKRGGGFFDFFSGKSSAPVVPDNCNPNNLSQLKTPDQLRENYKTCCPKTFFGMRKNSSPYCKQVELNMNAAVKEEGLQKEYVGMEPMEVAALRNVPGAEMPVEQQAPNVQPMLNVPPPTNISSTNMVNVGGRRRRTRKNRRYRK